MGVMKDKHEPKANLSVILPIQKTAKFIRGNGLVNKSKIYKGFDKCGNSLLRKFLVRID